MSIRPRLAAVWITLGLLVAADIVLEIAARTPDSAAVERSADALLPVSIEGLGAVEVGYAGSLHRFERNSQGIWLYHGAHGNSEPAHEHRVDPAKADTIGKSLAGLARARVERRFPLEGGGEKYGFASPRMLIVIYRVNERDPVAQYAVGDVAPDSFSRYVQKVGAQEALTIANYQVQNLVKLIESMRS